MILRLPTLHHAVLTTAVVFLTISTSSWAKTPSEVRAACRAEGRPCVGLVLSGGGARGFAHVGVIKVLEELGVKIDVIAGTSMGSMVGGAYAAGFTSQALEDTVLEVDWSKMLAPRPQRDILSWRRKLDDYKSLPSTGIEISNDGTPRFPDAFVPSEELDLFLARKTASSAMVEDLSMLPIPFAAPATNLVTGKRVVMQKDCTLSQAMRASMSVPGAFSPAKRGDELLVDGGLVDNLPVDLAREMGADIIIAVNVGTPLSGREQLNDVVGVMSQMVNLLTEQNVTASLASLSDRDILIRPELKDYTSADLDKSREIIAVGEAAGRAAADRLKVLAVGRQEWTAWNLARTQSFVNFDRSPKVITEIRVAQQGDAAVPPERIVERAAVPSGRAADRERLDDAARTVWADGYFDSVVYRLDPGPDGSAALVIEPKEKRAGYSSVRLGGSLETDFDSVSTYNLLFAHSWHLLNAWGGEWRNEIQVGDKQRFLSEFYQPLGRTLPLFVQPSISYERMRFDRYSGHEAVAQWRSTFVDAEVLLGWELARLGYAGLSAGWLSSHTDIEIGRDQPPWRRKSAPYIGAELMLDTLDSVSFPTEGMRLQVSGKRSNQAVGLTESNYMFGINALVPFSVGRWTSVFEGEIGRSSVAGMYQLGGAGRMPGVPYGRWSGSRLEYAKASLMRNVSDWMPIRVPVWIGGALEAGRAWNDVHGLSSNVENERAWAKSVSASIGVDSLIGPIFLVVGRTKGEGTSIYFRWGYRQ